MVPVIKSPLLEEIPELKEYVLESAASTITIPRRDEGDMREYLVRFYKECGGDTWPEEIRAKWCSDKPLTEWAGISSYISGSSLYSVNVYWDVSGSVDFSGCRSLGSFAMSGKGNVGGINIAGCSSLREVRLDCFNGNYTGNVDASGCQSLGSAIIIDGNFTAMNFNGCSSLYDLQVNNAETITFTDCTSLEEVFLGNNQRLKYVDASNCPKLQSLNLMTALSIPGGGYDIRIGGDKLERLNVSGCTALESFGFKSSSDGSWYDLEEEELEAYDRVLYFEREWKSQSDGSQALVNVLHIPATSLLQELDMSGVKVVQGIDAQDTALEYLNLSQTGLQSIDTYDLNGPLHALNVSGCTSLTDVDVTGRSSLQRLDASDCTELETLRCDDLPALQQLQVKGSDALFEFTCRNTALTQNIDDWINKQGVMPREYDARYVYDYIQYDEGMGPKWYVSKVTDNGTGWYYRDEPGRGYHDKFTVPWGEDFNQFGSWANPDWGL